MNELDKINEEIERKNSEINKIIEQVNPITKLKKDIEDLNSKKEELIKNCKHLRVVTEYKSDTGNYDRSCDWAKLDITCIDCNSKWVLYDENIQKSTIIKNSILEIKKKDYDLYQQIKKLINSSYK